MATKSSMRNRDHSSHSNADGRTPRDQAERSKKELGKMTSRVQEKKFGNRRCCNYGSVVRLNKLGKERREILPMRRIRSCDPCTSYARRFMPTERQQINEQIGNWTWDENIRPSISEDASSIAIVKKRDGSIRVCVDYRQLKKIIVKDNTYVLPLIDDQL